MGYTQKRTGRDGKPRYTAVYHDLRGERRSAGTFANKKDANTAWQRAEAKVGEGCLNDPRRGLRMAAGLPETLAAGFDAFEVIRMTARHWQDRAPGLFASFMSTADAAVDGREALTIAPSLPPANGAAPRSAIAAATDPGQAADAVAAIAS